MKVLHNFGREDQVDKAAIERLAGSLCRLLDPGRPARQDAARRGGGAGAVRAGRQPGAGPLVQARGRALGWPPGLDRPAARDH